MRFIFIVGLPRTGTKLVKSIIEGAEERRVKLAPEIWFFGDLFRHGIINKISSIGDMKDDANVRRLVDYLFSGNLKRSYCKLLKEGRLNIDRDKLYFEMIGSDRSNKSIYTILMRLVWQGEYGSGDEGEMIVGDKMPGNLFYVPLLMEWFPDSKIIHTFRDPRAILASEQKRIIDKRYNSKFLPANFFYKTLSTFYVLGTWIYAVRLHDKYKMMYPDNYHFSCYEELLNDPETKVGEIAKYLGLGRGDGMLSPSGYGSSYSEQYQDGFDRTAVDRWRKHLSKLQSGLIKLVAGHYLRRFEYEP